MHCGICLQSGQAQVAALGLEGDGVGDDEAHPEACVQLAEVDVAVLAHVDVLHAVELKALWGEKCVYMGYIYEKEHFVAQYILLFFFILILSRKRIVEKCDMDFINHVKNSISRKLHFKMVLN